jgi:glutamate-1-semialdehyde 2,1-aminomutase
MWRTAAELFPGGVNSPVRAYRAVGGDPPMIFRGAGSRVWDGDGREYVDFVGAYGPLIVGHAHPDVVEAIITAAMGGGPFGHTTPWEVELAQLIVDAFPSIERLRFVCSGTEAAMSALRVARAATKRDLVLKFEGSYHGHSDALLAKAGSGMATLALPDSAGVPADVAATTLVVPFNDLDAVEAALERHMVAAVIVEAVVANAGVVLPHAGYLEGLRVLTQQRGTLLIFDEVITGFRVARGGAQALFGVTPDLTLLGKIIGGGLPVGAYGGRADLMDLVAPVGPVYQAGTLAGHPIAMAAGAATLRLLDDAAYARLESLGQRLERGLARALPGGRVVRQGSLLTAFVDDFPELHRRLRAAGILIPPSQFEAWFISMAHDERDIDRAIEAAAA